MKSKDDKTVRSVVVCAICVEVILFNTCSYEVGTFS